MAFTFSLSKESLKRKFAVYVVVAKGEHDTKLYVGKIGDNNDGCNPIISRCGNHFSYNKMHSQVRNKIDDHEGREYTYVFDHFDDYPSDVALRRACIDKINEMERWLNERVQALVDGKSHLILLNPYHGVGIINQAEKARRAAFRTAESHEKIDGIIDSIAAHC
jgi:hypothetical protein